MAAGDLARLSEDLRGSMDRFMVTGAKPRISTRIETRPLVSARRTTEVSGEIALAAMRRAAEAEPPLGGSASPRHDSGQLRALNALNTRKNTTMPGLGGAGATSNTPQRKPQPTPIHMPSAELNATMRFLGYSEDGSVVAGDPPTVNVSSSHAGLSKARTSQAIQYNDVDDLFDALPNKAAARTSSSLSFEDHASDLERHMDDPKDEQ
jgi:hypothetical protein